MAIISEPNIFCGLEQAISGDTVIVNSTKTNPFRTNGKTLASIINADDENSITISGPENSTAYILHTVDISHLSLSRNFISNGYFSDFSGTNKPAQWITTNDSGSIAKETGIRLYKGLTGLTLVEQNIFMIAGKQMSLKLSYKNNSLGKYANILIWDRTTNKKLLSNGLWGASDITLPDSVGTFSELSINFIPETSGKYTVQLYPYSRQQPVWFSSVDIHCSSIKTWVSDGNIYKTSIMCDVIPPLLYCLQSEWDAVGCDALFTIDHAATLTDCRSNPLTCFQDSDWLYFNTGGVPIDTLHIESGARHIKSSTVVDTGIELSHNNLVIKDISAYGANGVGLNFSGGAIGMSASNYATTGSRSRGIEAVGIGTIAHTRNCRAYRGYDDGIDATGGAILNSYQDIAEENWDEGFEAWGAGGVINATQCISLRNGRNGDAGSEGMVASDTATLNAHGCLSLGNAGCGLRSMISGTITAVGCISYGNGNGDVGAEETAMVSGCHHNNYGVAGGFWSTKGGDGQGTVVGDPLLTADYHLRTDSPCLGTGAKIPGLTTDIEGNPLFPPYNIGPYGMASGALGVAPLQYPGPPRNNITRLTGTATAIDPSGTYELEDTNAWRVVTGWTAGTANDFFDENGVPTPFTGQQAIDAGIGPRLYCGLKGIAGYTVDQDAASNAKIIRTLKVPAYIDTLYYSDFQEMDWSATSE